jgi:hypothetical protein
MKPKLAYRPCVETLESRLQPGSMITNFLSGWPSLAGTLALVNPGPRDSQSSGESSMPALTDTPVHRENDRIEVAVASVAAARSETVPSSQALGTITGQGHTLSGDFTDNLADGLANQNPSNTSLTGRRNSVPLALAATPPGQQPPQAAPQGSVHQSPNGVATPAPSADPLGANIATVAGLKGSLAPTPGIHAVPVQMVPLGSGSVDALASFQIGSDVQAVPLSFANGAHHHGGAASNQAAVNFLSYLGASGPDALNNVAVRNENGANFIYVVGSVTDSNGRTDIFAAKLTDGASTAVWGTSLLLSLAPGPDSAFGLALNGNSVYLAGTVSDPSVPAQSDGLIAQLDARTGRLLASGFLTNGSLAAVTTDVGGNVYAAGWIPDPTSPDVQDASLIKLTGSFSSTLYSAYVKLKFRNATDANGFVTTGGGLIVNAKGDIFLAGGVSAPGDPTNNIEPLYVWLNDASGQAAYQKAVAVPNATFGPGGMGTAVAFDPTGNIVFTGTLDNHTGTPLNQDMVLGRMQVDDVVQPNGHVNRVLTQLDAFRYYVDDRTPDYNRVGDWTGNDLVTLPDGSSIVVGAAYDPAAPNNPPVSMPTNGTDVHMTHFVITDDGTPTADLASADPENTFGGSGTDIALAAALDPTNPANVYVVGSTDSIDLPTSSGALLPAYSGGSTTGFVGQATVQ